MLGGSESLLGESATLALASAGGLVAAVTCYVFRDRLTAPWALRVASLGYAAVVMGAWLGTRLLIRPDRLDVGSPVAALGTAVFVGVVGAFIATQLVLPLYLLSRGQVVAPSLGLFVGTGFVLQTALTVEAGTSGIIIYLLLIYPAVIVGTVLASVIEALAGNILRI